MEFVTSYSDVHELADALKGCHGKEITNEYKIVYCGQMLIGMADNTDILDKNCKCKHYDWVQIGNKVWLAINK